MSTIQNRRSMQNIDKQYWKWEIQIKWIQYFHFPCCESKFTVKTDGKKTKIYCLCLDAHISTRKTALMPLTIETLSTWVSCSNWSLSAVRSWLFRNSALSKHTHLFHHAKHTQKSITQCDELCDICKLYAYHNLFTASLLLLLRRDCCEYLPLE